MKLLRVAALLIVLIVLGACSGGSGADSESATGGGTVAEAPAEQRDEAVSDDESLTFGTTTTDGGGDAAAGGGESGEVAAEEPGAEEPAELEPLPDAPDTGVGDRIIKEGTVSIEVEQGDFDRAYLAVVAAARRYGGDSVGSSTRTADNGDTFGSVTVRVPVDNFEDLLIAVGDIGQIKTRDVDSQDVSAEFTDIESRLRHLKAQERFYLGLFEDAKSVRDAIAVQQQLEGIQSQIERLQGRLNFLDDRTSFSTLTVELFEPGAGGSLVAEDPASDRPTFSRYWETARDAFVNVVGAILVVGVFVAPLLIVAAAVVALWVVLRRRPQPATARRQRQDSQRDDERREDDPVRTGQ